jgi:hypothetical protein
MKNLILLGIIFLVLWILYSLNVQYGWVELQLGWTKIAIGVAAAGGPIQYLKQKADDKAFAKQETENEFKFRTLKQSEFLERQRNNTKHSSAKKEKSAAAASINTNDFSINEPTLG